MRSRRHDILGWLDRAATATTTPGPIAVARVGLALAALLSIFEYTALLFEEDRIRRPLLSLIPPVHGTAAVALMVVGFTAGVCLAIGLLANAMAALVCLVQVAYYVVDVQTYSSHHTLVIALTALLAFAHSDAGRSLQARLSGRVHAVPWWPQLLMMVQISVLYLFAGLSKINPIWLDGSVLADELRWSVPPAVQVGLACLTIVTEVALALALWHPRTRRWAVLVGILLHLSIVTMLRDPFALVAFALACVPLYPLFLTRPSVPRD
ncbi:HTTM domain-containing protein [Janibacter sp. G56]|uniref:HTTM domain-containing protein n=1 Tax=Janibacter sp. G56 TaxID=3418717 RepID=UPI003D08AED2